MPTVEWTVSSGWMVEMSEELQETEKKKKPLHGLRSYPDVRIFTFKIPKRAETTPKNDDDNPIGDALREIQEEEAVVIRRTMSYEQKDLFVAKVKALLNIDLIPWGIE